MFCTAAGLLIPFIGTSLGALTVFFMREERNGSTRQGLLGFAAGVMIAASVWSLLLPSIEMAREQGRIAWVPAATGFLCGAAFLPLAEKLMALFRSRRADFRADCCASAKTDISRDSAAMLIFAVTLHNIPEGMAVGVAFAAALTERAAFAMAAALALSLGIAIQNFPEGAIISMPLRSRGMTRLRACGAGVLSGAVEPVSALLTLALTGAARIVLPYLLAFAAGAMIGVVLGELIPEAQNVNRTPAVTLCAAFGFTLMMVLDVALQ